MSGPNTRTRAAVVGPVASPRALETGGWTTRWGRRAIVLPVLAVLTVGAVALLPLLLAAAVLGDVLRPRRWVLVRCTIFFVYYLLCESIGVVAAFVVWLASGVWAGGDRARFVRWNLALQHRWGPALYWGGARIFGFRTEIAGAELVRTGPMIVFVRHVSTVDTVLPVTFLSRPSGMLLRYVLKAELLWDPCLDIVGHRLPNYFVRRGSGAGAREVAAIRRLADDLGPRDGVLIYPEGTRFTVRKRARILERLAAAGDTAAYERAAALRAVLPPRLGGALALLEGNRGADVVFCAHTGLEGAGSFWSLLGGGLTGVTVRVRFWRVPFAEIPREREARIRWLHDHWRRVDQWVVRHRPAPDPAAAADARTA